MGKCITLIAYNIIIDDDISNAPGAHRDVMDAFRNE